VTADELWRAAEVMAYLKKGRSTVYRLMKQAEFPKPVRPGGGHPRWKAREVREWALREDYPQAA
jgi:predicted DNA-binding transcriptional regulator AlpA